MTYHVQMSIEGALDLSDKKLGVLFNGDGAKIREHLQERIANGEKLIGAKECELFDPVKGCPGHKDEDD